MELKINEIIDLPAVTFNFEDLKKELTENLKKYQGLVYTESSIKDAKTDRANLNKLSDSIDTRRKDIKNKYLEPYNKFEAQIKELEALIQEPKNMIDKQIKDYEEKKKEQKRDDLKFFFGTRIGDLADLITFESIFNEKWLNATYETTKIQDEIVAIIDKTNADFKVIEDMKSEFENVLKDYYLQKRDLTSTLQEKCRLELQKTKIEEQKKQVKQVQQVIDITLEETLQQIDFRVWVTPTQLNQLVTFIKENNIKYGKVCD